MQTLRMRFQKPIDKVTGWLKEKVGNKKGSLLWELMIVLAVLFMFIYTATTFVAAFAQYENLSYVAKTVSRQMEVSGMCDQNEAITMINELLGDNTPLTDVAIKINVPESTIYSAANPKVQLRERFSITVTANYKWHIIAPKDGSLFGSTGITIPFSTKVTGMSEVYWKV